jgi:hypothetical protein
MCVYKYFGLRNSSYVESLFRCLELSDRNRLIRLLNETLASSLLDFLVCSVVFACLSRLREKSSRPAVNVVVAAFDLFESTRDEMPLELLELETEILPESVVGLAEMVAGDLLESLVKLDEPE